MFKRFNFNLIFRHLRHLIHFIVKLKGKFLFGSTVNVSESIFRTNISTFIHFENTFSYLKNFATEPKKEMFYIGPAVTLQWLDRPCGIVDKRYWGTAYCAGTCIMMSYALVENIIRNRK